MSRPITINEAEFIAHALATELMNYIDEPIPPFNTRSPGILESCLAEPFQTFDSESLHPTFLRKVVVLFYLCIKNHPFENGNKRMAVALALIFCYLNKKWLDVDEKELYQLACKVAKSKPKDRETIMSELES